jgi:hypothetical protein
MQIKAGPMLTLRPSREVQAEEARIWRFGAGTFPAMHRQSMPLRISSSLPPSFARAGVHRVFVQRESSTEGRAGHRRGPLEAQAKTATARDRMPKRVNKMNQGHACDPHCRERADECSQAGVESGLSHLQRRGLSENGTCCLGGTQVGRDTVVSAPAGGPRHPIHGATPLQPEPCAALPGASAMPRWSSACERRSAAPASCGEPTGRLGSSFASSFSVSSRAVPGMSSPVSAGDHNPNCAA